MFLKKCYYFRKQISIRNMLLKTTFLKKYVNQKKIIRKNQYYKN